MQATLPELAERLALRLDEELALYDELEEMLAGQLEALQEGQPEMVQERAAAVERCHHLLKGQERRRRVLLEAMARELAPGHMPTLREVADLCPPALAGRLHLLGRRLRQRLHRVHELRGLTGRVVEKSRRFNRRRLELLLEALRPSDTYGPDARRREAGSGSRIIDRRA